MADIFAVKRPDGSIEARACGYSEFEAWALYRFQVVDCWMRGTTEAFESDRRAEGCSVVRVKIEEVE